MQRIYEILNSISIAAQKTYKGIKRSDLKNSDFLFPETRSFPIVTPADVSDAISNFGRMKSSMSYDNFLKKLYSMCKRKGSEFVAALPQASKDKLGIKDTGYDSKIGSEEKPWISADVLDLTIGPSTEDDSSITEDEEYKQELYEMSLSSLRAIKAHVSGILNAVDENKSDVKDNLTEPWLQGKIAITEDYVRNIHDFIMFSQEMDDTPISGSNPGLWDNIRKKKEREGKKYRPAKPGDKDRPDSDQWKKLTK